MKIGAVLPADGDITLNKGKRTKRVEVANTGDRPIQVGSHFHFFEVNKYLKFDRSEAFGYRLDVPSGTSIRFEPGESVVVPLVELGGKKLVYGLNDLTRTAALEENKSEAMKKAADRGML